MTLSPHTLPSQINGAYLEVLRLTQEDITLTQFFATGLSLWAFVTHRLFQSCFLLFET